MAVGLHDDSFLTLHNAGTTAAPLVAAALADDDAAPYKCHPADLWMRILCVGLGVMCMIVGGFTNITTIISICTVRSLWRFTNINIFILAVLDGVVTTYVCGHFIYKYWYGCWTYSLWYCRVFNTVDGITYFGSLVVLALVAYDRYLMVRHGARYQAKESAWTVSIRTLIVFSLAMLFVIPLCNLHWLTGISVSSTEQGICILEVVQNAACYISLEVGSIFLPLGVMLFCYLSVLRYRRSTVVAGQQMTSAQLMARRRAGKLINIMFLVLLVTNVMYFSLAIFVSLFSAGYFLWLDTDWWLNLYLLSYTVAWINNAVNPLLYAHAMPEFRRASDNMWASIYAALRRVVWFWKTTEKQPNNAAGSLEDLVNTTTVNTTQQLRMTTLTPREHKA